LPVIKYVSTSTADQRVLEVAGQWYTGVNQDNFYRQIRNFVIDMTQCTRCTGVHWQVAQATSISNMYFKAGVGSQNQGMWMENGSGGFMNDIIFEGGVFGMWVGNQQFTSRNITVRSASKAAIYLNWDWIWTFKNINIYDSPVGIDVNDGVGSFAVLDSYFSNVSIGIRTKFSTQSGVNSLLIDNVKFDNSRSPVVVVQNGAANALTVSAGATVKSWAQGHIWKNQANTISTTDLSTSTPNRPQALAPNGKFFEMSRPNYATTVDVTTLGVVGDGTTDITAKLQAALNSYAGKSVLFFPHGIYLISDTVTVPAGTRMVGQVWSVLMASGNGFRSGNPKPMLKVGAPGQTGIAQLSDFMISTQGPQPTAVLVEWNLHDPANSPGSCGMWDVHYRIGGAEGTRMSPSNCPKGDGGSAPASACAGAYALLHVTTSGNLYMENVWGWVADHDIDHALQVNIYNARGFLCESQGPMWLYGTAMEHSLYYQYNFRNAKNVFMGAIQTETPYFQPSSNTPFAPNDPSDPTFCTNDPKCKMAYGLVITNSSSIYLYSAGLYSFFDVWSQSCLNGSPNCQNNMALISNSKQIYSYDLSTYGSVNMLTTKENYSQANQNTNTFCATVTADLNNW